MRQRDSIEILDYKTKIMILQSKYFETSSVETDEKKKRHITTTEELGEGFQ